MISTDTEKSAHKLQPMPDNSCTGCKTIKGLKYLWRFNEPDNAIIQKLSHAYNLSLPIAHLLFSRGFKTTEQVFDFLFTSFEKDVSPASLLAGAEKGAERIMLAIKNNEKILIFGDYDVDGITSTSLLLMALFPLGANLNFYLPVRRYEGYGLSSTVVQKAVKNGYKLIITVDNGITAFEAAAKANELGIDLIITDHHIPLENLPQAHSIINPNLLNCSYPFKQLAGVGVTFKLISLIYEKLNLQLPEKIYELLMLGTVADVVPLVGENRFWVKFGLSKAQTTKSHSLAVLALNSNLTKERLNSLDIGFMIAPQINALGRLDDPRQAVKFLVSANAKEVEQIGEILRQKNEDRKKIDRKIYEEIEHKILSKKIDLDRDKIILDADTFWPSGVIGLVAGKLANNYGRPSFLFHLKSDGSAAGSCRSIPEFNIFEALQKCQDLLISFGGHAHAAGLKLSQKNLPTFKERMNELVAQTVSPIDLQPKITVDAFLSLSEINKKLVTEMIQMEPFGNQNPEPTFLIKNVSLLKAPAILKDKHVKISIFADGVIKPVIFFNRPELYRFFKDLGDGTFDLLGTIIQNEWEGETRTEINGIDIKIS